ncbi:MAG: hypothetical protein R2694_11370 [Ilumatobacteraceae bacterium]
MNDDLEHRLQRAGQRPVPPLPADRVQAMAARLDEQSGRRAVPWAAVAAAAAVLIVAGVAVGLQRDGSGTLQPATPVSDAADTTTAGSAPGSAAPSVTATTVGPIESATSTTTADATAPATSVPAGGAAGSGVPTTQAPPPPSTTSPPTTMPTTAPPPSTTIPSPSFTLGVQRIGDRLVFNWQPYSGGDGTQYVLVRVTAAGLQHWPVDPARVARVVFDMSASRATIDHPDTTRAAWQLVVLGADRQVVAVSEVVFSN